MPFIIANDTTVFGNVQYIIRDADADVINIVCSPAS